MFVWWVLKNTVTTWYQIKSDPVCEPSFLWNELIDKSVCYWLLYAGLTIWQIVVHFNEKRPLAFNYQAVLAFLCIHVLFINYTADFPGTSLNYGDKSHLAWKCSVSTEWIWRCTPTEVMTLPLTPECTVMSGRCHQVGNCVV